jgi:hypothetical protein
MRLRGFLTYTWLIKGDLMLFRVLLLALLMICTFGLAYSQVDPSSSPSDTMGADKGARSRHDKEMIGEPQQEMLVRREIETAEKEHRENVDRAREAAQLSTEIRDSFLTNKALGKTEAKKLDRLEKVTRKIRSEAGGSEDDATLDDPPNEMTAALSRLAETSDKLKKGVENTPRQVISASVIEHANEVLELIHYVRSFTR